MKRIKLTHGSARVEDNIKQETIDALNNLSELAYNVLICSSCKKILDEKDLKYGKKSEPKLCVSCFTCNA